MTVDKREVEHVKRRRIKLTIADFCKDNPKGCRELRKLVTGDPNRSIKDHLKEKPQVKWIDKLSFTLGTVCICFTEWLALHLPERFPAYFYALTSILLLNRYLTYVQDKYELFMLDFCYFLNLSVICQTWLFPENLIWFKANFSLAMGPLILAIAVWNNSLVFHSCDKLTSFFMHFFPPLTLHLYRWSMIPSNIILEEDELNMTEWLFYPLMLYIVWQFSYLFIIEIVLSKELRADPKIITSLRYMATNKKGAVRLLIKTILLKLKMMKKDDDLDPDGIKTKLVFVIIQLIYTALTILPVKLLYKSYDLSLYFIFVMFIVACWNGASYYIEVFSERYNMKFITVEKNIEKDADEDMNNMKFFTVEKNIEKDADEDMNNMKFFTVEKNIEKEADESLKSEEEDSEDMEFDEDGSDDMEAEEEASQESEGDQEITKKMDEYKTNQDNSLINEIIGTVDGKAGETEVTKYGKVQI